jgi:hypothetical protein
MFHRVCVVALTLALSAAMAGAEITPEWVPVDNSGVLTGYSTVDLFVTTETGVCCAALLMTLDSGSLFYFTLDTGNGGSLIANVDQPPPDGVEDLGPPFEPWLYTTYVTIGGEPAGLLSGGDAGGDVLEFSEREIDVSWYSFAYPVGRAHMGRFTFTEGAVGDWTIYVVAADAEIDPQLERSGTLAGLVPEPTSLALWGPVWLMVRRRR